MGILDEYKSPKNRDILINASLKMIKDKYNVSINDKTLDKIVNNIISVISNDAILLNISVKLIELNNLTLAKVKEFVGKQIKMDKEKSELNDIKDEQNSIVEHSIDTSHVIYNQYISQNDTIEQKISEDDELLNKLQELEEKRRVTNSLLLDQNKIDSIANSSIATEEITEIDDNKIALSSITEHIYKSVAAKKPIVKKTFIINSHSRDWINQPVRNILQFNISIDLQQNFIEPYKIIFPSYVKDLTPLIHMIITDGSKVYKYIFILHKNNGDWDEWVLINNHHQNVFFINNDWKITFLDFLNKDLKLGNDDIKICEVSSYTDDDDNKGFLARISFEKSNFTNSEYNLERIRKYDNILLKTYSNTIVNITVIANNIDTILFSNNDGMLRQEDFINSKLLNTRAQYFLIFSYYSKEP